MTTLRSAPGSRLPIAKPMPAPNQSDRITSAPTRLEQLQLQYQRNIQKAKEEKLREMYFQNPPASNRALIRLTSNTDQQDALDNRAAGYNEIGDLRAGGGQVRGYFQQRREQGGQNNRRKSNPYSNNNGHSNGYGDVHKQRTAAAKPPVPTGYKGVGRDKSKPLAPISRDNSYNSSSTLDSIGANKTYTMDKDGNMVPFNTKAVRARNNPSRKNSDQNANRQNDSDLDTGRSDKSFRQARPAAPSSGGQKKKNFKQWQEEQKMKKDALEKSIASGEVEEPQSDFQRWHQAMDNERDERLAEHHRKQPAPAQPNNVGNSSKSKKAAILHSQNSRPQIEIAVESDDDNDDENGEDPDQELINKQKELEREIEQRQLALGKMRIQNQKEELEEQRKQEAERKKKAKLAARQKKLKQEEEEARRREEEQEEKLRRLEKINNNNQQIIHQHSTHKNSPPSNRTAPNSHRTYDVPSRQEEEEEESPAKYFHTKPVRPRSRKASVTSVHEQLEQKNNQKNQQRKKSQPSIPPPLPPPEKVQQDTQPEEEVGSKDEEDPAAFYTRAAAAAEAEREEVILRPCDNCGRKFAEERLAKHIKVCKESAKKLAKRKPLDSKKMRVGGTEFAKYQSTVDDKPKKKKNNWKVNHENFMKTLKYSKAVTAAEAKGESIANIAPPPVTENPDYKQCPYCKRKFSESAAERHIAFCKNSKSRPKPLPPKTKRR